MAKKEKKLFSSLGLYHTSNFPYDYINIYGVQSCAPWSYKGSCKVHYGNNGTYIWFNHTTYYLNEED